MTPDERNLITGLFDRLRGADTQPKDREAEQLIQAKVAELPAAPYLLAQTVLVQEHALTNAQARIAQLERQAREAAAAASAQSSSGGGAGSFLSGLFGGGHQTPTAPAPASAPAPQPPAYPSTVGMAPSAGGGFLRTALAAAAGVAGGSLLMNGIQGLMGGHNAGPFGSAFGGGGFGGGNSFLGGAGGARPDVIENTEIVNNYYGDQDAGGSGRDLTGGHGLGNSGAQPTGAGLFDDNPGLGAAPSYQEADYEIPTDFNDPGSDDSGADFGADDFSGGGDDSGGSSDDGGGLA